MRMLAAKKLAVINSMRPKRQDRHTGKKLRETRYCCYKFTGNVNKLRNCMRCSRSTGYEAKWSKAAAKQDVVEYSPDPEYSA